MSTLTVYGTCAVEQEKDFMFHPRLVSGDPIYERLSRDNPRKLKRMIREEQQFASMHNAPEYQTIANDSDRRAKEQFQRDVASGTFAKRAEEFYHNRAIREFGAPTPQDRAVLGFDTNAPLTKRDVKNAYRRMARKVHSDHHPEDREAADDNFKMLYISYRRVLAYAKA